MVSIALIILLLLADTKLTIIVGFTIGGARQQLSGDEVKADNNVSKQIVKQMREELEDILTILKK